ncbi:MAG: tyrosine-protein phosphatase [Erysipelothrix sp.]|jgi:protein-tyrosine phosphatase|nr:tyrosine-protein phosphatase [Erysipelothrix sp.]
MQEKQKRIKINELGGYQGHAGSVTKRGAIFRSGNLKTNPESLSKQLSDLNVSMVFDLRSTEEVNVQPYVLPRHIEYRHTPVLAAIEDGAHGLSPHDFKNEASLEALKGHFKNAEDFQFVSDFMMGIYETMGKQPQVFGEIMKAMIENKGQPVLFHCSAGKDRTGVLASLILLALGVALDDVKAHYLQSNTWRAADIEHEMQMIAQTVKNQDDLDKIKGILIVKEAYLDAMLKSVQKYPSFETFAQAQLGLDESKLSQFRALYLE